MVVTTRSWARCGRGSDHDLRRDLTPTMQDKTDTDSRGVNDPRAATEITVAIDGGGRSRPDCQCRSCPADSSGRSLRNRVSTPWLTRGKSVRGQWCRRVAHAWSAGGQLHVQIDGGRECTRRSGSRFYGSAWARQDCPRCARRFAVLTRPARSRMRRHLPERLLVRLC